MFDVSFEGVGNPYQPTVTQSIVEAARACMANASKCGNDAMN